MSIMLTATAIARAVTAFAELIHEYELLLAKTRTDNRPPTPEELGKLRARREAAVQRWWTLTAEEPPPSPDEKTPPHEEPSGGGGEF